MCVLSTININYPIYSSFNLGAGWNPHEIHQKSPRISEACLDPGGIQLRSHCSHLEISTPNPWVCYWEWDMSTPKYDIKWYKLIQYGGSLCQVTLSFWWKWWWINNIWQFPLQFQTDPHRIQYVYKIQYIKLSKNQLTHQNPTCHFFATPNVPCKTKTRNHLQAGPVADQY